LIESAICGSLRKHGRTKCEACLLAIDANFARRQLRVLHGLAVFGGLFGSGAGFLLGFPLLLLDRQGGAVAGGHLDIAVLLQLVLGACHLVLAVVRHDLVFGSLRRGYGRGL
jgi:hypothetical protein